MGAEVKFNMIIDEDLQKKDFLINLLTDKLDTPLEIKVSRNKTNTRLIDVTSISRGFYGQNYILDQVKEFNQLFL